MKSLQRRFSCFLVILMLFQCFGSGIVFATETEEGTQALNVQMYNGNRAEKINSIFPWFKLKNTGTKPIKLKDVKLRYYYTIDGDKPQNFWCDYSIIGASNVTGTFVKMEAGYPKSDYYLEIGFKETSGTLLPGNDIQVQTRFAKNDWSNFDQTNDYSFNPTAKDYADGDNFTAYIVGSLENGEEPKLPLKCVDKYAGVLLDWSNDCESDTTTLVYTVKRKTDGGEYSVIASDIKDSGYFDKNVEENKTYTYLVIKTDNSGKVTNLNAVTLKHVIVDTDMDGLPNDFENMIDTDKTKADTDGNGIMDGDEDADKDGITNIEEIKYGTSLLSADTDNDGLPDYDEIYKYHTDPCKYDTDEDGMGDGVEVINGLNPINKDTDKDGIIDSEEIFEQSLLDSKYKDIDITKTLVKPNLKITGCGDYSKQINIKDDSNNKVFSQINSMVGHPFEIVHDNSLNFKCCDLSFKVNDDELKNHNIKNLKVAWYNTENNEINILDTNVDDANSIISTTVNHFSCYFVIDIQEYYYDIDVLNKNSKIDSGKADVVFTIDTTGSMGNSINNVKNNINNIVEELKSKKVDVRLGLVGYKDITYDGLYSTKDYGWFNSIDDFKNKVSSLCADGGGDWEESAVDGLEVSRIKKFRSSVNKYIILITDAGYKNGAPNNPDMTMNSEISLLQNDNICASVVTNSYSESYYKPLYINTNGIIANIDGSFSTVLKPLIEKMATVSTEKTWIRLSNGEIVALDDNPANGNPMIDTDSDGISDVDELDKEIEKSFFDPEDYTMKTYKCWTFKSNPAKMDTDGDGINDIIDSRPCIYDLYTKDINVLVSLIDGPNTFWNAKCPGSNETYKHLLVNGFKKWENNGNFYNVDGIGKVSLNVNVLIVDPRNEGDPSIYKKIEVDLASFKGSSHIGCIPWSKDKLFIMTENIKDYGVNRTDWQFQWSVAHELGHVLGLGDAYDGHLDSRKIEFDEAKQVSINPNDPYDFEVPEGDVMNSNWNPAVRVTDNDVEMMIQAEKENKFQYFQDGEDDDHNKKSIAITSY